MSSLEQTDKESAANATAPRVTLASMEAKVATEEYIHAGKGKLLTICVLTMRNGFSIVGKSAPASPANFNEELGKKFAREDAMRQAWGFEGYLLREQLATSAGT